MGNEYLMDNDSLSEQEIESNLPNSSQQVSKNEELWQDDIRALTAHNVQYTELLKTYVDNIKVVLTDKREKKEQIFEIALILLWAVPLATFGVVIICILLYLFANIEAIDTIPALLTAFGTMVSTMLVIPKLISEYLFNKEEEQTMASVIAKIQEYDINVRNAKNKKENDGN